MMKNNKWYSKNLLEHKNLSKSEFKNLWNPELFDWARTVNLIHVFSEYLDVWWHVDKIQKTVIVVKNLTRWCKDYKDIWIPDLLKTSKNLIKDFLLDTLRNNFRLFQMFLELSKNYLDDYKDLFLEFSNIDLSEDQLKYLLKNFPDLVLYLWDNIRNVEIPIKMVVYIDHDLLAQIKTKELLKRTN